MILVPLSFGVSSISLLHVLDSQLKYRQEQGRPAGYNVHLLHIDQSSILGNAVHQGKIDAVRRRFPSFRFATVVLEACFDYGIGLDLLVDQKAGSMAQGTSGNIPRLKYVLSAASSQTSEADIVEIIRRRLIAAFAQKSGCYGILYGDTTTRLAEKTLSEIAKGRGGSLPWLTTDGITRDGVHRSYPMRDLLKKELNIYASITEPPLTPLTIESGPLNEVVSSKEKTIGGLLGQFFESIEETYPSVVANVVRTLSKLKVAPIDDIVPLCGCCRHHIPNGVWGGDQREASSDVSTAPNEAPIVCYGCARTLGISSEYVS
ncbi:MAG: hypothetical protein Q9163_004228 [Psora crenata]